ncbi:MAG: hypothetical protein HQL16_04420 [Candidatus Omnitrophica bacterium]|nr:hypothetical protein [Candidatus Omnitrophota bacterium]
MAKRKQSSPRLSAEVVRNSAIAVIILIMLFFIARGLLSLAGRSAFFTVKDVIVADDIKLIDTPDLLKFRGVNIFSVDIDKAEQKIRARYPQFANLRILRRFPDQIFITAVRRDPVALSILDTRAYFIDKNGFIVAPEDRAAADSLALIRGIKHQKVVLGDVVRDTNIKAALGIVMMFKEDALLSAVPLRSLDVTDPMRIVCVVGEDSASAFEVFVDKNNYASRGRVLGTLLSHREVDLTEVKYIDLRFLEPIIGKKKAKKT